VDGCRKIDGERWMNAERCMDKVDKDGERWAKRDRWREVDGEKLMERGG
jgi:hypothetical protein